MPLRLKAKKRDVIRIGQVLVGIDYESPDIIVIIDAPKDQKVTWITNPGVSITKLMAELKTGKRPLTQGLDGEPSAS